MPIRVEISPLHRLVFIVARGRVTADEIRECVAKLIAARVPRYGKIVDVSSATSGLPMELVQRIAALMRGGTAARGPVAFVVNPERKDFAHAFAEEVKDERLVRLFRSLHEARRWIDGFKIGL